MCWGRHRSKATFVKRNVRLDGWKGGIPLEDEGELWDQTTSC